MSRRLLTRAIHSGFAFIGLVVAVFFLSRLTGDPAALYVPINATSAMREQYSVQHGFDKPLWDQFGTYVNGLVHLDFGTSLAQQRPAIDLVEEAFPWTLALAALTMPLAVVLATLLGALAAFRPGSMWDKLASNVSLSTASIPDFWLALVGILIFAVTLRLLPVSGTGGVLHWILPVGVLVARPLGVLVQVCRGALVAELSSAYVKTARAKGLPQRRVVLVHALRNALAPILTVAGDQAATIINGAVVVETIFGWPGIGQLMINSVLRRDYAVILAAIIVTAAAIFVLNIVIDILYVIANPRLRASVEGA